MQRESFDAVGALLAKARSALVVTGSVMSAEAGLPSYRGMPGLQRKLPGDDKLFDAALSVGMLAAQPVMTWRYLFDIDGAVRATRPSPGHDVLAKLERSIPRMTIMTVNVDRLHQRAGSRNVLEMHGALHDLLCKRCELSSRHDSFDGMPMPPRCAVCHSVLRPDMPLFGEPLPIDPFTRLQAELEQGFDIVLAIGIQTMSSYLARPLLVAKSEGIPTVEIGPQHTELSDHVDFQFRDNCSRVLERVWEIYQQLGSEKLRG